MTDNRCPSPQSARETVCIDTMRVLDSCKDKDCFTDVKVFVNRYGQELLDRAKAETVDLETVDDTEIMLKVLKVIRSTGAK